MDTARPANRTPEDDDEDEDDYDPEPGAEVDVRLL